MKLLVDVLLQPDRPDLLDVAGPRPEADPVQHVDDGLVVVGEGGGGWCGKGARP